MGCGMDRVFPKPFPIKDFGQLLLRMNFIAELPENLRIDSVQSGEQ